MKLGKLYSMKKAKCTLLAWEDPCRKGLCFKSRCWSQSRGSVTWKVEELEEKWVSCKVAINCLLMSVVTVRNTGIHLQTDCGEGGVTSWRDYTLCSHIGEITITYNATTTAASLIQHVESSWVCFWYCFCLDLSFSQNKDTHEPHAKLHYTALQATCPIPQWWILNPHIIMGY